MKETDIYLIAVAVILLASAITLPLFTALIISSGQDKIPSYGVSIIFVSIITAIALYLSIGIIVNSVSHTK